MSLEDKTKGMPELMEVAVAVEEYGEAFYEDLARRFEGDTELVDVFRKLSRDEASHRDQFAALRSRVQRMDTTPSKRRAMQLQAEALETFFRQGVGKEAATISSKEDALETALQLERRTLEYYESMQDALGDEPTLLWLIREEKRHVEVLMRTMVTDAKFRSLDDDFTGKHPEGAAKQDARIRQVKDLDEVAR